MKMPCAGKVCEKPVLCVGLENGSHTAARQDMAIASLVTEGYLALGTG